jgi:hypothetical protein
MIKRIYAILLLSLSSWSISHAQNCAVNAGINQDICLNGDLSLNGLASGLFKAPSDLKWRQIAGPSVLLEDENDLKSRTIGLTAGNSYTFRLSGTCDDGVVANDQVVLTVLDITDAMAGANQLLCPGSNPLSGNAVGANETGAWDVLLPNNAGVSVTPQSSPTASATTPSDEAGVSDLVWTITHTNGCVSKDTVKVTNYGGESPVKVTPNTITIGQCYSATQCYDLSATFGGNGFGGQEGTWSQVSGPTIVTFDDVNDNESEVCNLSEGCYKLKWTVAGGCVTGSDTIRICVPAPTQTNTNATSPRIDICDGRTTIQLVGSPPIYNNETVKWTKTSGAGSIIIDNDTSSTTLVTGLNGTNRSRYTYTITNDSTGCSNSVLVDVRYRPQNRIDPIANQILACGATSVNIPYTSTGQAQRSLISAPSGYGGSVPSSFTSDNSPLNLSGLNVPGTYIYQLRRRRTNVGARGCIDAVEQVTVITSESSAGVNAGTDLFLPCGTTSSNLAGNEPDDGVIGTWSQVSGPNTLTIADPNSPTSAISGFANGKYVLKWTLSGGLACGPLEGQMEVVFSDLPPQSVTSGTAKTICYGSPFSLEGNAPLQGEVGVWSVTPSAGVTFSDINSPTSTVDGLVASTAYSFKWKVENKCGKDSSTVVITTNNIQGAPAANAGTDQCEPTGTSSITLDGNDPGSFTGLWTKISGPSANILAPGSENTVVNSLVDGTYEFEWSLANGSCDPTRDTVEITIAAAATTAAAGSDIDSCSNSITLAATAVTNGIGTWSQVSGPAGWEVDDINSPTARFTSLVSGSYGFKWTVSNGSCIGSEDIVKVNIDNVPTFPTATVSQKLCGTGTSVSLNGNTISNGTAIWSTILKPGTASPTIADITDDNTTASGLITGIYQFERATYSTFGLCPSYRDTLSDTIVVSASLGADLSYCIAQSSLTLTGNEYTDGTWTKVTGPSVTETTLSDYETVLTDLNVGTYNFEYEIPSTYGCPATKDSILIILSDSSNGPSAGLDQELCNATSITLDGNDLSPNTGTWTKTFGPSATITDDNLFNSGVTGLTAGLYLFEWRATNGACNMSDEVRVEIFTAPTTAAAGLDQNICPERTELAGNVITTGLGNWTQVGTTPSIAVIDEPVNPTTAISGLNTVGTYTFEWVATNGSVCPESKESVDIIISHLNPTVASAGADQESCNVISSNLAGNAVTVGSGLWSEYATNSPATLTDNLSPTTGYSLTAEGTYGFIWTATNGSCVSKDSVEITMYDLVSAPNAGVDRSICFGDALILDGSNPTPQNMAWSQISGPSSSGFVDSTLYNTGVFGLAAGVYKFKYTGKNGSCPIKTDTVDITVDANCTINISGNLYQDGNGLKDNSIDGTGVNQPDGTQMYVSLVDNLGAVVGTAAIASDGSYDFLDIPNYATYSMVLHSTPAGSATPSVPANWVNTGENTGAGADGDGNVNGTIVSIVANSTDIINVNFGIEKAPETTDRAYTLTPSPLPNTVRSLTSGNGMGNLAGTDAEDGSQGSGDTVVISSIAAMNGSTLFYDANGDGMLTSGEEISVNDTIKNYDPAKLSVKFANSGGVTSFEFEYAWVDNAGIADATPARYTVDWSTPLPVEWLSFDATLDRDDNGLLTWSTASELNNDQFTIMKLGDDREFYKLGVLQGSGTTNEISEYTFIDYNVGPGTSYYKIVQQDYDGTLSETEVRSIAKSVSSESIVYPNPAHAKVYISMESSGNLDVKIYNGLGIDCTNLVSSSMSEDKMSCDIAALPAGVYYFEILEADIKKVVKVTVF